MPTSVLEVNSQAVRVLERGEGDPVVVLHGWGGRIESMAPVISCLEPSARAEFVRDVLVTLGIERAAFVGQSFGAKTSLYLAATHRDLVAKLVAQGASGLRSAPSAKSRAKRAIGKGARFAGKFGPPGRALRGALYERIASQDYKDAGDMRPILVKVVNEDIGHLLSNVAAPTLLVWGTKDDAAPLAHGRRMEQLIPDAGLVTFEGAGHFAYLDEPDRFCTIVRHFLKVQG
jgi:pimeloyl-ACP methyl ester carboxylesterase